LSLLLPLSYLLVELRCPYGAQPPKETSGAVGT
jgi:hypothetical protein